MRAAALRENHMEGLDNALGLEDGQWGGSEEKHSKRQV